MTCGARALDLDYETERQDEWMILDIIAASAKERVAAAKEALPLAEQIARARELDSNTGFPFEQALANKRMSFICEVKKASPSKGLIAPEFPYVQIAREYEAAGADALSLINTITGMKIDIHRRKFAIANKTGGMSGPAIKPIAVRMVYQVAQAVKIPIIGMGGIATAEDAIEFILAGASAVSVGAMNFVDPYTTIKVVEGIEDYMRTYHVENLTDLIGAVE